MKRKDVIYGGAWRIFPIINVDRVEDIPADYPGVMGVPVTIMKYIQKNDGRSGFLILGICRPVLNGKRLYKRLLIRNLKPDLPEEFDPKMFLRGKE